MDKLFSQAIGGLLKSERALLPADKLFEPGSTEPVSQAGAFLLSLAGDGTARKWLIDLAQGDDLARFFLETREYIAKETEKAGRDGRMREAMRAVIANPRDRAARRRLFFPEGADLPEEAEERAQELRAFRKVDNLKENPTPISKPGAEILFTSNVLLTVPSPETDLEDLDYSPRIKTAIRRALAEEQIFWYDHPIQIGVPPESNETIYGLRGLDRAVQFERKRGDTIDRPVDVALSVSVTHKALRDIAKEYIETEIQRIGGFSNLHVYVFTESQTARLVEEVFLPAGGEERLLAMFGVDGEYGRHYSFLKAIAALWHVAVDPAKRATFKIDLDQVFPQKELNEQTGASAFEHFKTPLWGATGLDSDGEAVELGMIAGALVNERDIHKGVYTPDVVFPERAPTLEEEFFFSKQTMALSTAGELMTRYGKGDIDGAQSCIQRIHVTGGTNGILIDSLRRHRPFTPSFIARAEDQAYILSVLLETGVKLRYLHKDGLIMRHDKEAFADSAIKAASFGNIIGDYIRTIYFSAYAKEIGNGSLDRVKRILDPFTGCFITPIPITVAMLRLSAKAAEFHKADEKVQANRLISESYPRLDQAIKFAQNSLPEQYRRERQGWNLYYDLLPTIEKDRHLRSKTKEIIETSRISGIRDVV